MTVLDRDLEHARRKARRAGGWCSDEQGRQLFSLAAAVPDGHDALEVGSFKGRSAIWLGLGLMLRRTDDRDRLWCVDNFRFHDSIGCSGHKRCTDNVCRCPDPGPRGDTLADFRDNVAAAGLADVCVPVRAWSQLAAERHYPELLAAGSARPLAFVYVDGGHRYDEVRADFDIWHRHVVVGGTICFDDVTTHADVARLMEELDGDPIVERAGEHDKMVWWTVLD